MFPSIRPAILSAKVLVIALVSVIVVAQTPRQQNARSFVENLYILESRRQFADFSVFLTPSLAALVEKDRKAAPGEIGKLDFDPICDCQDSDGLRFQVTHLTRSGSRAVASVSLHFNDKTVRNVRLSLLRESDRWSIDDIQTRDFNSLREFLTRP
jgi:hypothetical protein